MTVQRMTSKWATRQETAAYLRVHPATIIRWVAAGLINEHKVGGKILYDLEEIDEFVRSRCFTKTPDGDADESAA